MSSEEAKPQEGDGVCYKESMSVLLGPVQRVAVAGGTHGNEMSGLFLVKHWLRNPQDLVRDTFAAESLLANPKASELGVRYCERDLNRCFTLDILCSPESPNDPYEVSRAKEINKMFGPKGSANAYDLMLDMHNTTSNMGVCLIVDEVRKQLGMHACHYIQTHLPEYNAKIYLYAEPGAELYSLDSIAKASLGFELGPQPQGVVRADILQKMRRTVEVTLDFIDELNKGKQFEDFQVDVYQHIGQVDFPRNADGEISAIIHPSLQDKDFLLLQPGDPIFLTLDGQTIPYSGEKPLYPVFINEAAYYEKKIAFILTEKIRMSVPALSRK
ncbi:N-acyl-aromatic-L-amino acid amidohydrolase (carboxylate-forming) [Gastrophryne carolinensis]